jgi:hypothetical protein
VVPVLFVDVVVHSYRVRYGLADPDPAYADLERRLSENPDIRVAQPCSEFPRSPATVGRLNAATGGATGALSTPGAYQLLDGPAQAVIEASGVTGTHAHLFLTG